MVLADEILLDFRILCFQLPVFEPEIERFTFHQFTVNSNTLQVSCQSDKGIGGVDVGHLKYEGSNQIRLDADWLTLYGSEVKTKTVFLNIINYSQKYFQNIRTKKKLE